MKEVTIATKKVIVFLNGLLLCGITSCVSLKSQNPRAQDETSAPSHGKPSLAPINGAASESPKISRPAFTLETVHVSGCFAYSQRLRQFACSRTQEYAPGELASANLFVDFLGEKEEENKSFALNIANRGPFIILGEKPTPVSIRAVNQALEKGDFLWNEVSQPISLKNGAWVSSPFALGSFRLVTFPGKAPWGQGIYYRLDYKCFEGPVITITDGLDTFDQFLLQLSKDGHNGVLIFIQEGIEDAIMTRESKAEFFHLTERCAEE